MGTWNNSGSELSGNHHHNNSSFQFEILATLELTMTDPHPDNSPCDTVSPGDWALLMFGEDGLYCPATVLDVCEKCTALVRWFEHIIPAAGTPPPQSPPFRIPCLYFHRAKELWGDIPPIKVCRAFMSRTSTPLNSFLQIAAICWPTGETQEKSSLYDFL